MSETKPCLRDVQCGNADWLQHSGHSTQLLTSSILDAKNQKKLYKFILSQMESQLKDKQKNVSAQDA